MGALCVEFAESGGRLEPTGVEVLTGRVVCSDTRHGAKGWEYRLVLDPRLDADERSESHDVWVSGLIQHHSQTNLWEASVCTDDPDGILLRLNARPGPPWQPTDAMRSAVTTAHASELAGHPGE